MPRKKLPIVADDPYHISARCINHEWFSLPLDTVWSIMEDYLYLISTGYSTKIHAFVLMSNHFHLILSAPEGSLSAALLYFMRETSREISRLAGRINQTWGTRNHKCHIQNFHYYMNTYKYIYQNPVRAKICNKVEDYPFSTLGGLCGHRKLSIPVFEDSILFNPNFDPEVLEWLNHLPKDELNEEMRVSLKHPQQKFNPSRISRANSSLVDHLL